MFKKIILLFLVWRFLTLLWAYLGTQLFPLQTFSIAQNLSDGLLYFQWAWGNFDGVHYITISRNGYDYPDYAYFPLYPMVISFLKDLVNLQHLFDLRPLQIGLFVSSISLLISLFFVYKTALLDVDKKTAFRSLLLLLAFPMSFFYGAVYADSLFLLLSTISFFAARKKAWLLAGVFAYLASLSRLVGIVLLPALLIEWYIQKKVKSQKLEIKSIWRQLLKDKVYFLFLIPLGIISYAIYLKVNFGDFLLFQKAMKEWGQSQSIFPLQVVFRYLKIFIAAAPSFQYFIAVVEFIATLTYFALALYVAKKVRLSYGIFMFLLLLIPTFTGTFQSMPRYILHVFPAFIGLSLLTKKHNLLFWTVILIFLALQMLFAGLFTRGFFVA